MVQELCATCVKSLVSADMPTDSNLQFGSVIGNGTDHAAVNNRYSMDLGVGLTTIEYKIRSNTE